MSFNKLITWCINKLELLKRINDDQGELVMHNQYDFSKLDDISLFNKELNMLASSQKMLIEGLNLEDAYKNYYGENNRVYYIAIDLKLNIYHIYLTLRKLKSTSARSDLLKLTDFHRQWINFITLYRSFYDKFMNLVILVGFPDDLDSFDSAKSKNKTFKKILLKQPTFYIPLGIVVHLPEVFTHWTYDFINFINDEFRTSELHGAGSSRKWVFQSEKLEGTPFNKVSELMDNMGQFLSIICCIFSGRKYAKKIEKDRSKVST